MTNLIVASFNDEAKAIEASHKLTELESYGDITIYERLIVKKNAEGKTEVLQEAETSEGLRTLSGMAIGSLIGALAGPVGLLAGMFTGTVTGALADADRDDFADDFGLKVTSELQQGSAAIIAEVNEDSDDFIDDSLKPLGATIKRTDVDYAYDKYADEQVEAFDKEIDDEREKMRTATAAEKTKLNNKISELKEKRKNKLAELKEKSQQAKADRKDSSRDRRAARINHIIEQHQIKIDALKQKLHEIEHTE